LALALKVNALALILALNFAALVTSLVIPAKLRSCSQQKFDSEIHLRN
jgi:hypothetical protein